MDVLPKKKNSSHERFAPVKTRGIPVLRPIVLGSGKRRFESSLDLGDLPNAAKHLLPHWAKPHAASRHDKNVKVDDMNATLIYRFPACISALHSDMLAILILNKD